MSPMPETEPTAPEDKALLRAAGPRSVRTPSQTAFSNENAAEAVFGMFKSYAPLSYMLSWEVLDYVELLARWNPDYSQAVENIKTLANSGHNLFVDHSSTNKAQKIKERLDEKAKTIQESHGGVDGLITKLLDQGATFGAMCGEWVLNDELTDVIEFVDVNPKTIRFFWEDNHWAPYQKVTRKQAEEAKKNGQKIRNQNCVKLNEETFHYYAFDAAPGSPYGTPPYIAALLNIGIQGDMVNNMSKIVKKIGLLGLVDVSIKELTPIRGETAEQFKSRATEFLSEYSTAIQDMMDGGGIAHFDDAIIQSTQVGGNAAGATNIFKQNEELVFSGLNSMPSVQGRSYSTTETYAGVAYDIIIRNTYKYQKAVKRMIEHGYWLMATVWGETPKAIRIEFNSNKSLHRLQDAQSQVLEIKNALTLWATGIIDQQGFAQLLGWASIKKEYAEPPASPLIGNNSPGGGSSGNNANTTDPAAAATGPIPVSSQPDQLAALKAYVEEILIPGLADGSIEMSEP